jgi:hypothetical protein
MWQLPVLAAGILLLGATLPLCEVVVPKRYPVMPRSEQVKLLLAQPALRDSGVDLAALEDLAMDEKTLVAQGRVISPNFYEAKSGEPGGGWAVYRARPFNRLAFMLIGSDKWDHVMPMEAPPETFPHYAETSVVSCLSPEGVYETLVVVLSEPIPLVLTQPGPLPLECPAVEE